MPDVKIMLNNELVEVKSDVLAKEFLSQEGRNIQLDICSMPFEIDVNPPKVQNVKLPDSVIAGYLVYPFKLSFEFACQEDCDYDWFVSDPHVDIGRGHKTNWTHRYVSLASFLRYIL